MGDDRREIASKADDRRLVPWLAPCRFRRPSREGLPFIIPDRGELRQTPASAFFKADTKTNSPDARTGPTAGHLWLLDNRSRALRSWISIWRHGGKSAHCGERKKWRVRSISCDDGSGCASGVSCGRPCDGLYLGDDWPCVLLRAFESFACTTLPRRSWILLKETIIYNRLLARPQEPSWLQEQWKGTVAQSPEASPPRPLLSHAPRLTIVGVRRRCCAPCWVSMA